MHLARHGRHRPGTPVALDDPDGAAVVADTPTPVAPGRSEARDLALPSARPRRVRVRAGGRSEEVRRRVAEACLGFLAAGNVDFGPVDVARRSGVSRATIHRWWPRKSDFLREALSLHTRSLGAPDTGSWARDVRSFAATLAAFFSDPVEVSQNALMATGAHPEYTAAVLEHYQAIFEDWRAMLERARGRGEVAADVDADAVLLTLVSPLVLVPLLYRRVLSKRELEGVVGLVLRATATPASPA
jgi:AcrR family transcriptional regulator